jgi:hypothetical protein
MCTGGSLGDAPRWEATGSRAATIANDHHLFNHAGDDSKRGTTAVPSFFNALCLVMMAMTLAVDTSICERAFSLMNRLKSAKRNR